MKRLFLLLLTGYAACAMAQDDGRIYYQEPEKYTFSHFLSGLDVPTFFGVGMVPTMPESVCSYSSMYLEYRRHKSYDWFLQAGMETHNHNYRNRTVEDINVHTGERFAMDLVAGGGYRLPLVRDIRGYYERPYLNRWDLGLVAQIGASATHLKQVLPEPGDQYTLENRWYFFPILKLSASAECFVSPHFSIFLTLGYNQHMFRQPWDTQGLAGTLYLGIGFAGFFD